MDQEVFRPTVLQEDEHQHKPGVSSFVLLVRLSLAALFLLAALAVACYRLLLPPVGFTPDTLVVIPSGYSVKEIAGLLRERDVIRSEALFSFLVSYKEKEAAIAAGDYLFTEPLPLWQVVRRFTDGVHGIATHRVTFPEGVTVKEMSRILGAALPGFDQETFLREAKQKEGYFFPDTYFFYSTATSGPVILAMEENFTTKTALLRASSTAKRLVWGDVVTMASIVEKEAATARDRRIIAGILARRITIGMRLQVDAPFLYTLGKTSAQLTVEDLASDSPFNTYRFAGLPPSPIGNPGADAIAAVISPEVTPYLFYLSGPDGTMYYAKTFTEHKANKVKYLK